MHPTGPQPALLRYFSGLAEQTFETQLGVADPSLIDYIAELLARFTHADGLHAVRNLAGRPLTRVTEMLLEAEARIGTARREVHRHIGDYTLFWTGVYPETLPKLRAVEKKDYFVDYCNQGKRAYYIASTIETDREQDAPNLLLQRLSFQFELCAYGLGEVRREWERKGDDGPRTLMVE
jgi:hypothetical protein